MKVTFYPKVSNNTLASSNTQFFQLPPNFCSIEDPSSCPVNLGKLYITELYPKPLKVSFMLDLFNSRSVRPTYRVWPFVPEIHSILCSPPPHHFLVEKLVICGLKFAFYVLDWADCLLIGSFQLTVLSYSLVKQYRDPRSLVGAG